MQHPPAPSADADAPPAGTAPAAQGPGTSGRWPVGAVVLGVVALCALCAAALTRAVASSSPADPGALVRWGLPAVQGVFDASSAAVLGSALVMALASSPGELVWERAQLALRSAAAAWSVSAVVVPVLSFASLSAAALTTPGTGRQLLYYLLQVEPGRYQLEVAVLAVVVGSGALLGIRTPAGAAATAIGAAVTAAPAALGVDVALLSGHYTTIGGTWLEMLGLAGSAGVLLVVAAACPARSPGRDLLDRRCAPLVGISWAVFLVGWASCAWVQVGATPAGLLTGYGWLVLVQAVALVVLLPTTRSLLRSRGNPAGPARLVVVLLAAGVLVGAGAGRTVLGPSPLTADPGPRTIAEQAIEGVVPPMPPTLWQLLTEPSPDVLWLTVVVGLVAAYATGVRRLRARGDRWPVGRTTAWCAGCAVLGWVTSFGPQAYIDLMFSAHMLAHMTIMMVVPPLLVVGAPITLALRTLPRRRDGSRGPREWLQVLVHSRWARFVTHPVVAATIFVGSIIVFYYSPLFGLALETHTGHELMELHFLLTGYLFASAIIGVDPSAWRTPHPLRLVLLLAAMAFHAFFGVALTQGTQLLAPHWFPHLGLHVDPVADQQLGGGIAWGIGELPTIVLAIVLAVQWSRADQRESRRLDRASDRDGDAALVAYNAMLAARAGDGRPASGDAERPPHA